MEREKQIEEMGKDIRKIQSRYSEDIAEALYNAGYRKEKQGAYKFNDDGSMTMTCCGKKTGREHYGYPRCCFCGARMVGDSE